MEHFHTLYRKRHSWNHRKHITDRKKSTWLCSCGSHFAGLPGFAEGEIAMRSPFITPYLGVSYYGLMYVCLLSFMRGSGKALRGLSSWD
jgi:hypothetical protein